MTNLIFYVNGEYVPADQAVLPVGDLGLIRGYGVFDVLRTYKRTPFQLREHVERLQRSARSILITPPWSSEQLEAIVQETLARNYAANPQLGDLSIRLVLTGGPSSNGFTPENRPSLMVTLIPVGPRDEELYAKGGRLVTVQMERFKPTVKSLNYLGAIMAMQEATAKGAIEALYRTEDDLVTEGTRTSFLVVQGDRIITAPDLVLEGITRQVVMEIASDRWEVAREPIRYSDLPQVDEAMLVGTGKEVLPIVQIDDIQIGDGRPGPVTRELMQLMDAYIASVT
ncbi:MAG: aminotransferase class IV [Caldilineaceae bacterium]